MRGTINQIRVAVLFFASSVVFAGASFAQSAEENCLASDPGAEWDPKADKDGWHCRCSKEYAHASRANVAVCEDKCVKRRAPAADPSLDVSPAVAPPSAAPSKARASEPTRSSSECPGIELPNVKGWPEEFLCMCATTCMKQVAEGFAKWVPDDPTKKFCRAVEDTLNESGSCVVVARKGAPQATKVASLSCEAQCVGPGPTVAKWDSSASEAERCKPIDGVNYLPGKCFIRPKPAATVAAIQGPPGPPPSCEQLCEAQGDIARWNAKAPLGKQCEPQNTDLFMAGRCLVVPSPITVNAALETVVKPSCEDLCRAHEPFALWDPKKAELERCQPVNPETHLPGKCGITAMPGKAGEAGKPGAVVSGPTPTDPADFCEKLCRAQEPYAKWDPAKEEFQRCQPTTPTTHLPGKCSVAAMPGVPGERGEKGEPGAIVTSTDAGVQVVGPSPEQLCKGQGAIARWDESRPEAERCQPADPDKYYAGPSLVVPKPGKPGQPGAPGAPAEYICSDRCVDSGGTWLSIQNTCACKPGYHRSENGCSCVVVPVVPQVRVTATTQFLDRVHPELYGFMAGSWTVTGNRSLSVPVMGGPVVGLYFSLPRSVDIGIAGGLLFAGDRDRPLGSTVRGGLRWWFTKHVGLDLQLHGRFISTNADLENRLVQMGGAPGLAVRYRWSNHFGLFCKAGANLDYGLPVQAFMVGYDLACGGEF